MAKKMEVIHSKLNNHNMKQIRVYPWKIQRILSFISNTLRFSYKQTLALLSHAWGLIISIGNYKN